jgi:hypothetical protein
VSCWWSTIKVSVIYKINKLDYNTYITLKSINEKKNRTNLLKRNLTVKVEIWHRWKFLPHRWKPHWVSTCIVGGWTHCFAWASTNVCIFMLLDLYWLLCKPLVVVLAHLVLRRLLVLIYILFHFGLFKKKKNLISILVSKRYFW